MASQKAMIAPVDLYGDRRSHFLVFVSKKSVPGLFAISSSLGGTPHGSSLSPLDMRRRGGSISKNNKLNRKRGEKKIMVVVECPMCSEPIEMPDDVEFGDLVDCGECDREFEVVSLRPIELEWLDKEEEDDYEKDEDF
jgi:alpha-aminoadipate carrier protein LysW